MPQLITPDEYYQLVGHYIIASQAQEEVRKQEQLISAIVEIPTLNETISDAIYNSGFKGTKLELDQMLLKGGIMVEWKPAQNKFSKEEKQNVSG